MSLKIATVTAKMGPPSTKLGSVVCSGTRNGHNLESLNIDYIRESNDHFHHNVGSPRQSNLVFAYTT
jgi:hypothetical protein